MNKKVMIFGLLLGIVVSSVVSYVKAEGTTPVTINIQVKSLYSNYANFKNQYTQFANSDSSGTTTSTRLGSTYFRNALGVDGNQKWSTDANGDGTIPDKILEPGQFAFSYNHSDVTVNPSISGGHGKYSDRLSLSNVNDSKVYSFTFQDSSDVQLVIAAYNKAGDNAGCITGKIEFLNWDGTPTESEAASLGVGKQSGYGDHWYATDWYRRDTSHPSSGKAYSMNGLSIRQNSDSSTLEITNTDSNTKATTIFLTVYIGCSTIDVNLGGASDVSATTIDKGAKALDNGQTNTSADTTPVDNGNGNVATYKVDNNYDNQIGVFNNWDVVQSYVNDLVDSIKMFSYFYYGIAFLTSVLMLIYNIIAIAGATSNPMIRTRLFMRFGISVLCLALLGGSALLTRLFIITCMGG